MAERIGKEELVQRLAARMEVDETAAAAWLEAVIETLYTSFAAGESVTLPGFGSFYVRPERSSWVFKFSPSQRLRATLGWSSTYKGKN